MIDLNAFSDLYNIRIIFYCFFINLHYYIWEVYYKNYIRNLINKNVLQLFSSYNNMKHINLKIYNNIFKEVHKKFLELTQTFQL